MNFSEVFGEAKQFYEQLPPQQRQAVVQQFQQHFGNSADPQLQRQAQSLDPSNPDPQQLGQLHDYAQQNDPGALNRAMDHPQIQSAMSHQGVTDWGGGQDQQYQGQQGGGYGDQGGYRDQGGQPGPGSDQGYQQGGQYGQGDPAQQEQGGFAHSGGYQQDVGDRQQEYPQGGYSDQEGQRGFSDPGQGYQQGDQYGRGEPSDRDPGGY